MTGSQRREAAAGPLRDDAPVDVLAEEEAGLRPAQLDEFVGQRENKELLGVFLAGARSRDEPIDHVLLSGPPGLGKTTLAGIVAREMGAGMRTLMAPAVTKAGDVAAVLLQLAEREVLFIDEVHRLPPAAEEILYQAMEDFRIDILVGSEGQQRTMTFPLARFTLVGATTKPGALSAPLRDRFGISLRLDYYDADELGQIITRAARLYGLQVTFDAVEELARRSRGTPRIANRLVRRMRDFAIAAGSDQVTRGLADDALSRLKIDPSGLDGLDIAYLRALIVKFRGQPTGLTTLAHALSEDADTVENVIEPYLMRLGFVSRTPRGRVPTPEALRYMGHRVDDGPLFSGT
jgi:Holliday junction DNA helicase RuvB